MDSAPEGIEAAKTRSTVTNWKNNLRGWVDGYLQWNRGLAHGVQKDAIQNGWDAKKRGKKWKFSFELVEHKSVRYLSMVDEGTTGLTGSILTPEDLEKDLPASEKWGRFENVAFTKTESENAIGSRGRGKFIFLGASKLPRIYYDTLRDDGVYRFGVRWLTLTDSPIAAYEGKEAKQKLENLTNGAFKPLSKVGTRVIIVEPADEVVSSIETGAFQRHVGETWWQIISESNALITVNGKRVEVPRDFYFPEHDTDENIVYRTKSKKLKAGGKLCLVKELCIACKKHKQVDSKREAGVQPIIVDNDLQGIAIQRGGMKICSVEVKHLPKLLSESIYGYIKLNEKTEKVMQEHEGPEHYNFNFSNPVPRAVKNFIEAEIDKFAREKLGFDMSIDVLHDFKQKEAERQALREINKIVKDLKLFGLKGPSGGKKPVIGKQKPPPPVRLEIGNLPLPGGGRRINYGEKIESFEINAVNKSSKKILAKIVVTHLLGETKLETMLEENVEIPRGDTTTIDFPQWMCEGSEAEGPHAFETKLISMMPDDKGELLHSLTKYFWVEQDPPEAGGIFSKCEPVGLNDPDTKHLQGLVVPQIPEGYIYRYNINHPAKKASDEDLRSYLLELMAMEIPVIDLMEKKVLFTSKELEDPRAILEKSREIVGKILAAYYGR